MKARRGSRREHETAMQNPERNNRCARCAGAAAVNAVKKTQRQPVRIDLGQSGIPRF
jgi:hypothetical protein